MLWIYGLWFHSGIVAKTTPSMSEDPGGFKQGMGLTRPSLAGLPSTTVTQSDIQHIGLSCDLKELTVLLTVPTSCCRRVWSSSVTRVCDGESLRQSATDTVCNRETGQQGCGEIVLLSRKSMGFTCGGSI
ncbi:hypothetical protein DPEC_G00215800 [Dallia pectoralis]|uniref:Uncharacterized protein n=1 Tax=Dallia pectoralis TaxID=75939 RepID=A0ACC2G2I5_DALPE|nr:hypothetical protein DPEC_G00215800 [Dallia pectoralis]